MPDYKTVRLEKGVYEELQKRMRPMESMSQALERLLTERLKFEEVIEQLNIFLFGGKQ